MKIIFGLVLLLCVSLVNGNCEESYQVYPGIRCVHDIKRHYGNIEECKKACDSLPECAAFVHSHDGSRGYCHLKKDTCLGDLLLPTYPGQGLALFVKSDHAAVPRMFVGLVSKIEQLNEKPKATGCAFSARTNTDVDRMLTMDPLVFPVVDLNSCGGYDATTGIFTAPVAGTFWFHMHVQSDNTDRGTVYLKKNGEDVCLGYVSEGDKIKELKEGSYQLYPGFRCHRHDIKRHHDTIEGCKKACDSLPQCAAFVHSDDESRGFCQLKKDTCLGDLQAYPGLTMFVKSEQNSKSTNSSAEQLFTQRKSVWGITTSCSAAVKVIPGDKVKVTGDGNPARITGMRNGFSGFLIHSD